MKIKLNLIMLCLCGAIAAQAQPAPFGDNLQWELQGTTLSITSPNPEQPANMVFYSDIPWEASAASITTVTLPSNLTNIGLMAFYGCTALTTIELPDITTIEGSAFRGCTALEQIILPASLTSIDNYAFYGCSKLQNVYCLATVPPELSANDVFVGCHSDLVICVPDATALAQYQKTGCNWGHYYSDQLQVCSTTDINKVIEPSNAQTIKLIKQGHLYIIHNGEIFNVLGSKVK